MNIFELFAKLSLDADDYENGLNNAEKETKSFGSKVASGLKTAGKVGVAAIGALTVATGLLSKKILDGTRQIAAYGDAIDKQSQKMGISAEAYQEWDAVLKHSGASINSLERGMVTLSKKAQDNSDAFKKLGIAEEDVASMNQEDLFAAVIAGLQNMGEGTERTALASELLGGSAKELGALLNTSAKDTEAMKKRVRELGGVMSNDAVKAAAKYQDSFQDMQTAFEGARRGILADFLPVVTFVMDGLTELFSGNNGGIAMITNGINLFVDKISKSLPAILDFGSSVIVALASAIVSNLPALISAATKTALTLINGLVDHLPEIVKIGLQVLVALAKGIAENLPALIPTIVSVVLEIVDILTEPSTLSVLVDAAIAIIVALASGLIDALPKLIAKAPEIVKQLVDSIIKNAPKLWNAALELVKKLGDSIAQVWSIIKDKGAALIGKLWEGIKSTWRDVVTWGKDILDHVAQGFSDWWGAVLEMGKNIIRGIWEGIKSMGSWLWENVKGFFGGLLDDVCDFLGIASPSKAFAEIGKFVAEGFGVGFDRQFRSVSDDVRDKMASLADNPVTLAANLSSNVADRLTATKSAENDNMALLESVERMNGTLEKILQKSFDLVLDDGVIAGRIDKKLGQTAVRKARGNA